MLNKDNPVIGYSQCDKTKECQNHQCFFKRRDFHGLSPWATAYGSFYGEYNEQDKLHDEITQKYGECIFPKLDVTVGTNVIYVICNSFQKETMSE
jgi:hypothetical protein